MFSSSSARNIIRLRLSHSFCVLCNSETPINMSEDQHCGTCDFRAHSKCMAKFLIEKHSCDHQALCSICNEKDGNTITKQQSQEKIVHWQCLIVGRFLSKAIIMVSCYSCKENISDNAFVCNHKDGCNASIHPNCFYLKVRRFY